VRVDRGWLRCGSVSGCEWSGCASCMCVLCTHVSFLFSGFDVWMGV